MKKEVYEIDQNGYIIERYVAEFDDEGNSIEELSNNIITVYPIDGLYRAKWNGIEWVEGMAQEEIDLLNGQTIELTDKEKIAQLEQIIDTMLTGGTL